MLYGFHPATMPLGGHQTPFPSSIKLFHRFLSFQYFQQIQQLTVEFKAIIELSKGFEEQLNTSDQLVKALKNQLEAGNIQMTEYINAIKNYKTVNRNINLINVQKLQVINEMNFLLTQ